MVEIGNLEEVVIIPGVFYPQEHDVTIGRLNIPWSFVKDFIPRHSQSTNDDLKRIFDHDAMSGSNGSS